MSEWRPIDLHDITPKDASDAHLIDTATVEELVRLAKAEEAEACAKIALEIAASYVAHERYGAKVEREDTLRRIGAIDVAGAIRQRVAERAASK